MDKEKTRTRPTRRAVLSRGAGILGLLTGGMASSGSVVGGGHDSPGDRVDVNDGSVSWTRLYQGTASVTVSYFTELDREATGEFAVDVRFRDPETLTTNGPPFVFMLRTGVLLSGNFVTHESTNPYLPHPPLIEGSVWIETETTTQDINMTPVQAWDVAYDAQSGSVQGSLVQESSSFGANTVWALERIITGDYLPTTKAVSTQSTFDGNIGEDSIFLQFGIIDVDQTISATVEVSAERRA